MLATTLPAGASSAGAKPAAPAKPAAQTAQNARKQHATALTVYPGAATQVTGKALGLNDTETGPNWAGFVTSGTNFRYIQATWLVPRVNCRKTPGTTRLPALGADWVGIDGFNQNNPTVEQDGITAQCVDGVPSYLVWYEMFPKPPVNMAVNINPGDEIVADVFYDHVKHKYRLDLRDVNNGERFSVSQRCPNRNCQNVSAEVITESPAESASTNTKYYPLADIGTSTFWHIIVTDMAGHKSGLDSGAWNTTRLVMTGGGGRIKASTSNLGSGGTAFRTYWEHPY